MWKRSFDDGGFRHRRYFLLLLAIISAFNTLDASGLSLTLPNIKSALHLTDMDLGLLTGVAFSIFYSTVCIPVGRWADRGDRVAIIALASVIRAVMVMLVGATRSFGELLMVRAGAAIGEAGLVPAAYSLIADYFAREERPKAVAKFILGNCVGVLVAYSVEGWINAHFGWRTVFVCIGVPSLLIAPVAWWILSEPRRTKRLPARSASASGDAPSISAVVRCLWRNRTFRYLLAMESAAYGLVSTMLVWQPSFFVRSYGIQTEQLGLYFSLIYGVGAFTGTYGGGYLASRYAGSNERLQLRTLGVVNVGVGALWALVYLSSDAYISLVALFFACVAGSLQNGTVFATTQTVIPERMRAVSISVMFLSANLLGAGLGPLAVGSLSDALHPYLSAESLRYALLASCPGYLVICWLMFQAATTVVEDVEVAALTSESSVTCAAA